MNGLEEESRRLRKMTISLRLEAKIVKGALEKSSEAMPTLQNGPTGSTRARCIDETGARGFSDQ